MRLTEAIKDLVTTNGLAIIATKQFVYILDDMGAFRQEPAATKNVMTGLLHAGFGALVIKYAQKKDTNWQNVIRKTVTDYAAKSGYKDELVNHVAMTLLYSCGIISICPDNEPFATPKQNSDTSSNSQQNGLRGLMQALKNDYKDALNQLITIESDEFGFNYGCFTSEADAKLNVIEIKIKNLAQELGDTDIDNWLNRERNAVLDQNRPNPDEIKEKSGLLYQLQDEYRTLLHLLDKDTPKGEIDFSDYFLNEVRRKLVYLGSLFNLDMNAWCDAENYSVSEERKKRLNRRMIIKWVVVIAGIIGLWFLMSFLVSGDARARYKTTMAAADAEMIQGHYQEAVHLYKKAEEEYDASFLSSKYKKEAHTKAVKITDQIIANWVIKVKPLLAAGNPAKAELLQGELEYYNLELEGQTEDTFYTLQRQIDYQLERYKPQLINRLLEEIYANNGKLSEVSKEELAEMFQVEWWDYWLAVLMVKGYPDYLSILNSDSGIRRHTTDSLFFSKRKDAIYKEHIPVERYGFMSLGDRALEEGDSGSDVTELVLFLHNAGCSPDTSELKKSNAQYIFSSDIVMAIKVFQAYHGLPPTGELTPETIRKLKLYR